MLPLTLRWCVALTLLVALPVCAPAADTDPLRLVPDTADFFVKVEKPKHVSDLLLSITSLKELRGIRQYREYYDSTNFLRFQQLIAYYEKELGKPWPELLDQLAGGGAVVAAKLEEKPKFMLVLQGRDPHLTKRFAELSLALLDQELARQESKARIKRAKHNGVEVVSVGDGLFATVLDAAIVISNVDKGPVAAIELHQATKKVESIAGQPKVTEARKLAPADALPAWAWLNVETLHKAPPFQDLQTFPGPFSPLYVFVGGWLDAAKRRRLPSRR